MSKEIEKILNLVISDDVKVVSFDVFDTLLMRPCISPTDIFKLAGKKINYVGDIGEMRRLAEIEARRNKNYSAEDVTLDEIYSSFSKLFDIDTKVLDSYKHAELDTEYQLLYPRKSVKSIFEAVAKAGKKIIITSDMYLPKEFLQKVLDKNGYKGYSKIYVSCEEKVCKGSGNLFKKVISDYSLDGILPENILHIGDNYNADISSAKKNGLKAAYIPRAYNEFIRRNYLKQLTNCVHKNSDNSFLIGYIANTIFDDPFTKFDLESYSGGNITYFSYIMMMPFLFSFTKWLVEESIRDGIEELIMVYRDGFLPEEIIKILSKYYKNVPQIKKMYLSRAIRYNVFSLHDNGLFNSISDIPVSPDMSIEDFIKNRLLATTPEDIAEAKNLFLSAGYCSKKDKIGSYTRFSHLFSGLEKIYHKNASSRKKTVDRYCNSIIDKNKMTGVFDVGYRGSVSRFLASNYNFENTSYHLLANSTIDLDVPPNVNLKSYTYYGIDTVKKCVILHPLIEEVISKQEGSAINITEKNGRFEIMMDDFEPNSTIQRIQKEVVQLSGEFTELMGEYIPLLQFDHYLHFEFLVKFLVRPNKYDASIINNLKFKDSKFIISSNNIYERWYKKFFPPQKTPSPVSIKSGEIIPAVNLEAISNEGNRAGFYKIKLSLYKFCKTIHILPFAHKIYVGCLKKHLEKNIEEKVEITSPIPNNAPDYRESMDRQIELALNQLKSCDLLSNSKNTVVMGDIVSYDKGICNYLNNLSKTYSDKNFILLSEATWVTEANTKRKISFPFVVVPEIFGKNRYTKNAIVTLTEEDSALIASKTYLQEAVDCWLGMYENMSSEYAQYLSVCAYKFYSQALEILNTQMVILWNQFHGLHHIVSHLAKEKKIALKFMEFGCLPGTIAIDDIGQMGESYPAVYYKKFKKIAVSEKQLKKAKEILTYLKDTKMNRNVQISTSNNKLSEIVKNKPVIFYAGQNDYESGIVPYNEHSKKYHSPIFSSTNSALEHLADLCEKNDWQLIYKPHPIIKVYSLHSISIPEGVIYLEDVDINDLVDFADVTVTILSQVSYISLIREKSTLMLGYNQLRGKGCVYEAYTKANIENELKKAITEGYTASQKQAFIKHTAQLTNYYLYDDMVQRDVSFGQNIDSFLSKEGAGE